MPPLYTCNLHQLFMTVMARMSHNLSSGPHTWHVSHVPTSTRWARCRYYNTHKLMLLVSLHTRKRQLDPLYTSQVTMTMRITAGVQVAEEDRA